MAYVNVVATIGGSILTAQLDPGQTFGTRKVGNVTNLPGLAGYQMGFGTGVAQVNLMGYTDGTLVASTRLIDLSALVDPNGTSRSWARVKGILIVNFATADGSILKVGGAATNPWSAPFNGVGTSILVVPPGYADPTSGIVCPGQFFLCGGNVTALGVTGTSKVIQLDSGAATIAYAVGLVGCDA